MSRCFSLVLVLMISVACLFVVEETFLSPEHYLCCFKTLKRNKWFARFWTRFHLRAACDPRIIKAKRKRL